jgi:hypothetical protein
VPIATTGKIVKVSLWKMGAEMGNQERDLIPFMTQKRKDIQNIVL